MAVAESDYINLSNRVRISSALTLLSDIIPNEFIASSNIIDATEILYQIEEKLRELVKTTEGTH